MRVIAFLFITLNLMAADFMPDRTSPYLKRSLRNKERNGLFVSLSYSEKEYAKSEGIEPKTIPVEVRGELFDKYNLREFLHNIPIDWNNERAKLVFALYGKEGLEKEIQNQIMIQAIVYESTKAMINGLVGGNSCSTEQAKNLDQVINRYINLEEFMQFVSTKGFINKYRDIFRITSPFRTTNINGTKNSNGEEFQHENIRSEHKFLNESFAQIFRNFPVSEITWEEYTTNPDWFANHASAIHDIFLAPDIVRHPSHWKHNSDKAERFHDGRDLVIQIRHLVKSELSSRCPGAVIGETTNNPEIAEDHSGRRPAVEMIDEEKAYTEDQDFKKGSI